MKRGLIIGAVILVVVVVGGVFLLLSNLGSIIKTVVEEVGSDATMAKVTLDKAEVSVTSGQGALRGLTVGNPAGFKTDSAIRLGQVSVALDVGTVKSDVIVIKEIVILGPQVTYEFAAGAIHLKDIGKKGGKSVGASAAEVAEQVIESISRGATSAVGQINVGAIQDALKGGTAGAEKALKERAGGAAESVKKLLGK